VDEAERGDVADSVGQLQEPGARAAGLHQPEQVVGFRLPDAVDDADGDFHDEVVDRRSVLVDA
jgi:hypothetical protein